MLFILRWCPFEGSIYNYEQCWWCTDNHHWRQPAFSLRIPMMVKKMHVLICFVMCVTVTMIVPIRLRSWYLLLSQSHHNTFLLPSPSLYYSYSLFYSLLFKLEHESRYYKIEIMPLALGCFGSHCRPLAPGWITWEIISYMVHPVVDSCLAAGACCTLSFCLCIDKFSYRSSKCMLPYSHIWCHFGVSFSRYSHLSVMCCKPTHSVVH